MDKSELYCEHKIKERGSEMKPGEKITKMLLEVIADKAVKSSVKSANSACMLWQNQPKETDKIKKLRKF